MKMSFKSMEPTFAIKVSLKKMLELPTLIAHLTITMQTSTPECNKQIRQSYVDDDDSNADLSNEDEEIYPICKDRLGR
jgi:hypothetical protein